MFELQTSDPKCSLKNLEPTAFDKRKAESWNNTLLCAHLVANLVANARITFYFKSVYTKRANER